MVYTPQPESKMKITNLVNRLRNRLPVSTNIHLENSSPQGTALAVPKRGAHTAASAAEANSLITGTILKMVCLLSVAIIVALPSVAQQPPAPSFPELQWRMIGPFRGGRVIPVTGVLGNPNEYLFGAVGGGVWKTTNGGNTWEPIFDAEPIASIGAIAVAPSDPEIIYVGTGESDMRSDISYGDGVYKSTDGGTTWRNIGLRDSQNIGRILVDPRDPNTVLVAALGHAFGPNPERGVYRSTDGGATWKKVLSKNDDTGAIDLCWDAANPAVVYAALWQTRRPPWSVYAPTNGPGSGLYKSTDSGVTWNQITGHGFPSEGLGRIGIAIAPGQNGKRLYAVVDAHDGGIYRSDDAGQNWRRVCSDHRVWQRGWYFGGITADPRNPDVVYVMDTAMYRSIDGAEHFAPIKAAPGGDDYHSLWIAPDDPHRMILGSDQGAAISVDGAATWSSWFNQPSAQFYHVTTDNRFPYRVYGAQQDSGTAAVSSRSDYGQITFRDWQPVGGEESGYIVADRADPDIVYGGGPYGVVRRFNWSTGQSFDLSPAAIRFNGERLRCTWTSPLVDSPQNPQVLYFGAQFVLRSSDKGQSWQAISPDLTLRSAASSSVPNSAPDALPKKEEPRGVVYTIAPSPLRAGEIWAGTDNGLIQLTLDDGAHWSNVTPADIAEWSQISLIEASPHDAATAFAAVDRHQLDDFNPYIYRTHDSGQGWQKIAAGLPPGAYVHAVREDPLRKGLLFAGTELGVFVSFDDGDRWQPLQNNLPVSSVRDLVIHGDDLVVATHGRSFWILDDIAPLREWTQTIAAQEAQLFHPARAIRVRRSENRDTPLPPETPAGQNPPAGAIFDFFLKSPATTEATLEIHDQQGHLVRRYSSEDKAPEASEPPEIQKYWLPKFAPLPKSAGMHRFVWDLRYAPPTAMRHEYDMTAIIGSGTVLMPQGPLVLPGEYEVALKVGDQTYKSTLTVEMDPRVKVARADLAKQFELEQKVDAALTKATDTAQAIAKVREQLKGVKTSLSAKPDAKALLQTVDELDQRAEKIQGNPQAEWPQTPGGLIGVDGALGMLAVAAGSADSAPTATSLAAFEENAKQLNDLLTQWQSLQKDLTQLNEKLGD
jgi:photosystem II stability/assembly factor-like uncharacterized protein